MISRSWPQLPFAFTLLLCLQFIQFVYASPTNFTVEDDDPSIHYYPPEAWKWSWQETSTRGRGGMVGRGERDPPYPGVEYDRRGRNPLGRDLDMSSATTLSIPNPRNRRRPRPSQAQLRIGEEGGHEALVPATMRFDFIGSAVYLFGYSPLPPSTTLSIDGRTHNLPKVDFASYHPHSSPGISKIIYSNRTLPEGQHSITLTFPSNPENPSNYHFDHIVYTRDVDPNARLVRRQEPSTTAPSPGASISTPASTAPASPSATNDPAKKRSIATFAAAVGGSVGVLALFSAGLALSIVRRRYRAKKREREDREAHPEFPDPLDPHSSQDVRRTVRRAQVFGDEGIFGGRVRGGRNMEERRGGSFSSESSFVPRFFPGTEVPPLAATSHSTSRGARSQRVSLDEPPPPMYNDALESPVVPPPGLVTHSIANHPYIHRMDRRASLDSSDDLGLPISGRRGGGLGRDDLSYADIPPRDPPPPDVEVASVVVAGPPPSFPEAITSASSLPAAPLPVHQVRSIRSSQSMHSGARVQQEEDSPRMQGRPEAMPLLNPTSTSRPASVSSSVESAPGGRRVS